ncbi:MAG: Fe-S cluster assembly protein SufD [Phycisphaerae bacterium]|nr:Fe-S cluster assembly protein SufD [Gemmatimonadaceae bacterium]
MSTAVTNPISPGLLALTNTLAAQAVAPLLAAMRANGASEFARLGFPSTRNEDWLYTNVSSLNERTFTQDGVAETVGDADLAPFLFGRSEWPRVVFVNGQWSEMLSTLDNLPDGVRVQSLSHAVRDNSEIVSRYLGSVVPANRDGFSALNASAVGVGAVIHVAKEMVSDTPLHIVHVSTPGADDLLAQPRHLIVVEPHAKASVIESFVSLGDAANFTNAVTEVIVEDGATLNHLRIQQESARAVHIGTVEARQGRDSHFVSFSFIAGSALSRTNIYTVLNGEGCGTTLNGLYLLDGKQHGDTQTRVEHVAPRCFSREMYKGLLDGGSHGVFNGKVYVHPEAQKTDGKQTNQTLLLSDKARIDTKPQLEIFADDVKCTHGATVGRMDETALFYLKSRGVGSTLARQLLMYAFAADVLESIECEPVRDELERATLARYTGAPVVSSSVER